MSVTAAPQPPVRQRDRGRSFISDHPLRPITVGGQPGFAVKVRLTSYRSLPLSCIERISLEIDGAPVESESIVFQLDAHRYALSELSRRSDVWWFILDHAELLVSTDRADGRGQLTVTGTIVTVEPYMSNGRFHFSSTSTRTLPLESTEAAR